MDYFAHGLWSYILFHRIKKPLYAVAFGLLADSSSWMLYFFYRILFMDVKVGPPNLAEVPQWVFTLYGMSHSIVVATIVIFLIYIIFKHVPVYVYAWPIAILMDMVTHTRDFLPTPVLWPISDWTFDGISWGNGKFMFFNYLLILSSITYILYQKKKLSSNGPPKKKRKRRRKNK